MTFDFFQTPRIVFGAGRAGQLAELLKPLGSRVMLIHNGPMPAVLSGVAASAVAVHRQKGEPTVEDVNLAVGAARGAGADCLAGVGGGSAIDLAKAVAALLGNGGECLDYLEVVGAGRAIGRAAVPWIAVPATAGTGAEATRNAVISVPEKRFKASLRSPLILPRVALLDPALQVGLPANVTAASGMDALCQCVEAYTSSGASAMTDPLALQGIELCAGALGRAWRDGQDIEARSRMALGALLSGIALTNAGLGAVHGMAAPLGAYTSAPHGVICARLLPAIARSNIAAAVEQKNVRVLERYARVAEAMGGNRADFVGEFAGRLVEELRIPASSEFGLSHADIPAIIALARKSSSMKFNPVMLSDEALGRAIVS